MVNDVITGIASALSKLGEQYTIYSSNVKQGLQEPCFLLDLICNRQKRMLSNHFYINQTFSVVYIPLTENGNELREIAEQLPWVLEYILVGEDFIRGVNLTCQITENTVVCMVDYPIRIYKPEEKADYMKELNRKSKVR